MPEEEELRYVVEAILTEAGVSNITSTLKLLTCAEGYLLAYTGKRWSCLGTYLLCFCEVVFENRICKFSRMEARKLISGWKMVQNARTEKSGTR